MSVKTSTARRKTRVGNQPNFPATPEWQTGWQGKQCDCRWSRNYPNIFEFSYKIK
jgi:hypothetical protein